MEYTYIVRNKGLLVGTERRFPGDLIPEAADWPNLRIYLDNRWVEKIPVADPEAESALTRWNEALAHVAKGNDAGGRAIGRRLVPARIPIQKPERTAPEPKVEIEKPEVPKTVEHVPTREEWVGAGYKAEHYDSRWGNSVEPSAEQAAALELLNAGLELPTPDPE